MALRPEATEPAVDDLKRRARRRLVGAIVLALAAAVILPLLLESDPKPLGDEVSVRIPPVDNSKFVNPLSPIAVPTRQRPTRRLPASRSPMPSAVRWVSRCLRRRSPMPHPAAPAPPASAPKTDGAAKSDAPVKSQTSALLPAPAPEASPAKADAEAPKPESAKTEAPKTEPAKTESPKTEPPTDRASKDRAHED